MFSTELIIPLYLLVAANYLGQTLACRLQSVLEENMLVKHGLIFLTIVFVLVIQDPERANEDVVILLRDSAVIFALFFMSTRLPFSMLTLVLVFLFAMYIIHLRVKKKRSMGNDEEAKKLDRLKKILFFVIVALVLVGFVLYMVEKKKEYGRSFAWSTFLVGKTKCRRYTSVNNRII